MSLPEYRGRDRDVQSFVRDLHRYLRSIQPASAPQNAYIPPEHREPPMRVQERTTASNVTLGQGEMGMVHVVKATAAIDLTLPVMGYGDWVRIVSDTASTNDITVKDSDANTVTVITPGGNSGDIVVDITGAEVPV